MNDPLLPLQGYVPAALAARDKFPPNGVGPFVVRRPDLVADILGRANPDNSSHISGCRGAGKTTLLRHIGEHLIKENHTVYFFKSTATIVHDRELSAAVRALVNSKTPAYILLDETQDLQTLDDALVSLLKNEDDHKITVIGAGISNLDSVSNQFGRTIPTGRLFLTEEDLDTKDIFSYFCRNKSPKEDEKIMNLIKYIREYAGGHVYPVMRLSEILLPVITAEEKTEADAIAKLHSQEFHGSVDFDVVANRITPPPPTDLRPLLYETKDPMQMDNLMKKGFCSKDGKIVSHLLFDLFTESMVITATGPRFREHLETGVEGVRQVLTFALPKLRWNQYDAHGGAVEDALTFELILVLARVDHLKTRLFNPKLIDSGKSGRRPDIYLNTFVDAYVECVRTQGHTKTDVKSLEEHINRFTGFGAEEKRYDIGERDYAILHYQAEGTVPLVPTNPQLSGQIFAQRVFTFTMVNKHLYRGSVLVCS